VGRSGQVRKISPHTGIRPAGSESLYRLSYPVSTINRRVSEAPRAGLDGFGEGEIFPTARIRTTDRPACS